MRKRIETDKAPKAIGPYSQAIVANGFVYTSGQIPLEPKTGEMVSSNIQDQTIQVLENLKAVLAAANCPLSSVVKTTIFLTDLGNFSKVNEIYGKYFSENPPARSTVQVAKLPKDSLIEIEAVAVQA